jgi:hypothetical protein
MGQSIGSLERKVYSRDSYIKRTERSQINDLTLQLKVLEKQEKNKPQNKQKERDN